MYRWALLNTYDNPTGHWLFEDSAAMFGGVTPSAWSDTSALAGSITSDKDRQRSLLTQKGYPGRNAVVVANTRLQYGSTDGTLVVVLFRVKNTTAAPINWQPHFWYSCYRPWGETASVAVNGVNAFVDTTCETSGTKGIVTMSIPENRTSTVVFVSGSGIPAMYSREQPLGQSDRVRVRGRQPGVAGRPRVRGRPRHRHRRLRAVGPTGVPDAPDSWQTVRLIRRRTHEA